VSSRTALAVSCDELETATLAGSVAGSLAGSFAGSLAASL
jgi:hypothetical protein